MNIAEFRNCDCSFIQVEFLDTWITWNNENDDETLSISAKRFISSSERVEILKSLGCGNWFQFAADHKKGNWFVIRYKEQKPGRIPLIVGEIDIDRFTKLIAPELRKLPHFIRKKQDPAPKKLSNTQCKRCHRQLTDPISIKAGFGPDCREMIEKSEGFDSSFWENINSEKQEDLHQKYDIWLNRAKK